ncbi:sulfotransferase family protein [Litoreibacter meonggei]|uniref:Sulfotransferase family protein n=1 Tax=Litoreibacter meonggei TaxID=1049199 RepID=A0A497VB71_9RHOB|nr:sulfotransferase family 2 domain-containing protein [Litoreibacter meonggei]RLJ36194.1 sulfotransferase family protein [Litoreibacter meonggei]
MIINRDKNFGFVHIAKCAGSTIRQQLREQDDAAGKFYHSIDHPQLGWINGNHVPLDVLARYFPEDFEALRAVVSYTIVRDPVDRFVSGMSQYIRDQGQEPSELTPAQIAAHAEDVIAYMQGLEGLPDRSHILFARQEDYVFLEGARVITHVYAMDHVDALFEVLERRHGLTLIRDKVWNPTVTYRYPALTKTLKWLKGVGQKHLSMKAYVTLREIAFRAFTQSGAPKLNETLMSSEAVMSFVAEYYPADNALYHEAKTAAEFDKSA